MKFDEFDARMREYETTHDYCIPLDTHVVVRLDGRSFTRNTKEVWQSYWKKHYKRLDKVFHITYTLDTFGLR